jgi:uncharacterized protein
MSATTNVGSIEPSQDERTMAVLAHALQVVGWWIAPLIIFLVKRESKFVSFHALQALLLQAAYAVVWMLGMVVWMALIFSSVFQAQANHGAAPPLLFIFFFPLLWLLAMGSWVAILVIAILYSIKAGRGEWAEYPLIGLLAKKWLKIEPGPTQG